MKKGKRAGKSPAGVHVLDGKSYFWCSCGISSKQPFMMVHIKELVYAS